MDDIKNGVFPEPRSRQETYLQDIINLFNGTASNRSYPEPRSRQEEYLQIIISKMSSGIESNECKCNGKIHIVDETSGKKYVGEIKIVNNKPVLEYEETK